MKMRSLFQASAIRLAAALAIMFVILITALYAALFFYLDTELEAQIVARTTEMRDALVKIDSKNGFEVLSDTVQDEAVSMRSGETILLLLDDKGGFVAGNVRGVAPFAGLRKLSQKDFRQQLGNPRVSDESYFVRWTKVSKGNLLVGASLHEIRNTLSILRRSMFWGLTAALGLASVLGLLYAQRTQSRINALSDILSAVSRGRFEQRADVVGTGDDLDRVARLVNDALGHLQRLIEDVNQASSDVAHDLKKPIGRLQNQIESVLSNPKDADTYREVLSDVQKGLIDITATFDALLRISQIEAGERRSTFANIDLRQALLQVVDIYDAVIDDAGDSLVQNIAAQPTALISGDRQLLVQLFANLIENAIRHCPAGAIIALDLQQGESGHIVTLSDNGPGIPQAERENVFKRMYRLEKSRTSEGNGLGLSLVSAIAGLHHAKIELSDAQPGLRIEIVFPSIEGTNAARNS